MNQSNKHIKDTSILTEPKTSKVQTSILISQMKMPMRKQIVQGFTTWKFVIIKLVKMKITCYAGSTDTEAWRSKHTEPCTKYNNHHRNI